MPLYSSKNQKRVQTWGGGLGVLSRDYVLSLFPGALLLEVQHHSQLITPFYHLGLCRPLLSSGLSLDATSS